MVEIPMQQYSYLKKEEKIGGGGGHVGSNQIMKSNSDSMFTLQITMVKGDRGKNGVEGNKTLEFVAIF